MLDAEEYLHLAIHATQNNQHHFALEYLHKCLDLSPQNPHALFLLAAEHAELGLYKRAIDEMELCLSLDSSIEIARYQLALLYMQQGDAVKSMDLWTYLAEKSNEKALVLFAKGMLQLENDKSTGIDLIEKAVQVGMSNGAILNSMKGVLNQIQAFNPEAFTTGNLENDTVHPAFLNAYKQSTFDDEK